MTTYSHSDAILNERHRIAFHYYLKSAHSFFVLDADVLRTCASKTEAGEPSARTAYQLSSPHEHDPTMLCHTGIHA